MTAIFGLVVGAFPADSAVFVAPNGCHSFLTVQSRQCQVSHYYKCAHDPENEQWRADFGGDGALFVSHMNTEGEWLENVSVLPLNSSEKLLSNPRDAASISELLENGLDSFSFKMRQSDGRIVKIDGYDQLTGASIYIDGVTLLETLVEVIETDEQSGTVLRRLKGNEYIHPEWRLFFGGRTELYIGTGEQSLTIDAAPLNFIFPGESGFGATKPIYGCDTRQAKALSLPATVAFKYVSLKQDKIHDGL